MIQEPMQSNLERFLDCTTPVAPSHFLHKGEIRKLNRLWHPWNKEQVEYFTLADLWNCYDEWSAYGAGVPVLFNDTETLVQYYVPYLSAIQIYTSSSSIHNLRDETESRDGEARDSSSDSCSDESDSDKLSRWDGSSSEGGGSEQESPLNDRLGNLYFQYFDQSTPYGRVPLMDKINGFAKKYPGLLSLRSVDLSPASWMAVAWYPIYHIPMGRTIKSLSTCFLTYHTLSSSFQDMDSDYEMEMDKKAKARKGIYLRPFGMATYRMQGSVWASSKNGPDHQRLVSLLSVADSWLKQLMVQHHDFNHFTRRG
uniref:Uncharacterized protein n=1 Tax=Kalanchoe fedtschenkoi TaxID=63787 RepID=A0A7N0T8D7_KALFE